MEESNVGLSLSSALGLLFERPHESLLFTLRLTRGCWRFSLSFTPRCCLQGRYWLAATMETHLIPTASHKGEVGGGTRVNGGAHNHKNLYVLRTLPLVMDTHAVCNHAKRSADRGTHTPSILPTCSQHTVDCCLQHYPTNPAVGNLRVLHRLKHPCN